MPIVKLRYAATIKFKKSLSDLFCSFSFTFILADDITQSENKKEDNSETENAISSDHINENAFAATQSIHEGQQPRSIESSKDEHPITVDITPCKNPSLFFNLTLRSLGIIFVDIGTSP